MGSRALPLACPVKRCEEDALFDRRNHDFIFCPIRQDEYEYMIPFAAGMVDA